MGATMRHFPPTTCPGKTSGGCSVFSVVLIRSTSVSPNRFPPFRRDSCPTDAAPGPIRHQARKQVKSFAGLTMAISWPSYGHGDRAKQQLPPAPVRRRAEAPAAPCRARGFELVRLHADAHPAPGGQPAGAAHDGALV